MSYESYISKKSTEYLIRKRDDYNSRIKMCQDYLDTRLGKSYLGSLGAKVAIDKYTARNVTICKELLRRGHI